MPGNGAPEPSLALSFKHLTAAMKIQPGGTSVHDGDRCASYYEEELESLESKVAETKFVGAHARPCDAGELYKGGQLEASERVPHGLGLLRHGRRLR